MWPTIAKIVVDLPVGADTSSITDPRPCSLPPRAGDRYIDHKGYWTDKPPTA